jgi:predicted secreted hydrolase
LRAWDEAPHSAPVEWWYFSGHPSGKDAQGRVHAYGYEYVIFQFLGLAAKPVYLADLSVTDLAAKTLHFAGEEDSYPVPKAAGRLALHAGSWPASLGSSYYYSWTSLATAGPIVDHGVTLNVSGTSWMDHQWGPMALRGGGGWDWFSMQLSNGQQYMLSFIRNAQGQIVSTGGTRVADGGKDIAYLTSASIGEQATGSWTSPATGIKYGSGWQVAVPGGQLTVTPDLRDQEVDLLKTPDSVYWEGDVTIKGKIGGATVSGDGYTELNPPGA